MAKSNRVSRRFLHFEPLERRIALSADPIGLSTVDFARITEHSPIDGEAWYEFDARRDGIVSVEAKGPDAGELPAGNHVAQVTLYQSDGAGGLLELASGHERLDYYDAATGQTYLVRLNELLPDDQVTIANVIAFNFEAGRAHIHCTAEEDIVEYHAPIFVKDWSASEPVEPQYVVYNGLRMKIPAELYVCTSQLNSLTVYGTDGRETLRACFSHRITVMGFSEGWVPPENDLQSTLVEGEMSGAWGKLEFSALDLVVDGMGGRDEADLNASISWPGGIHVEVSPGRVLMEAPDLRQSIVGFEDVHLGNTEYGNLPTVELQGSEGDDTLVATPENLTLSGEDYSISVDRYTDVTVHDSDGMDTASLRGSQWDDTFVASGDAASLTTFRPVDGTKRTIRPDTETAEVSIEVAGFDIVHAYAASGGTDTAGITDGDGKDCFIGTPVYGKMKYADGGMARAKFFDYVHAYARERSFDVARLYDSTGDDLFVGKSQYARLSGEGFNNRVKFFEHVSAYAAAGGEDEARVYDSADDDMFVADQRITELTRPGYWTRTLAFDVVHAYSTAGGYDSADLRGSAQDTIVEKPTYAKRFGPDYYHRAKFFEEYQFSE